MQLIKPKFWDKRHLTIQALLLYPFTFILDLRKILTIFIKSKKYTNIKTICVGNIYLGGTGKTPLVGSLAKFLKKQFKTAIIKKRYQSHLDEKRLLEKNYKVFFKKKREISLLEAIKKKFELAIFDDGLQDEIIKYDLKIVCFNSLTLAGNKLRIPAGPLRETLENLKKYDAAFITGEKKEKDFSKKIKKINPKMAIFNGEHISLNYHNYQKGNYLVFSGIGNPNNFQRILRKYNIKFKSNLIFPDHYDYSKNDIAKIKEIAKNKKLKILTTEKDYYRIPLNLRKNINYLKIELKIENLKEFKNFVIKHL